MIKAFNPKEVLQISINVEMQGEKLYSLLEAKAKNKKLQKVWHYLSEQEKIHRKVFEEILKEADSYIVQEFNPGEYEAYLRAIAAEYIFTPELIQKKAKTGFGSDSEAVDFGIKIEKDSIAVYSALREYMLAGKCDLLDKVIDEEKKHYADLVSLKEYLCETQ